MKSIRKLERRRRKKERGGVRERSQREIKRLMEVSFPDRPFQHAARLQAGIKNRKASVQEVG